MGHLARGSQFGRLGTGIQPVCFVYTVLKCDASKCGGSTVHFSGMFDVVIENEFCVWTMSAEFVKTEHFIARMTSTSCGINVSVASSFEPGPGNNSASSVCVLQYVLLKIRLL